MRHSLRSSLAVVGLAVATANLASSCATTPPQPESMRDSQADFSAYKTYGWYSDPSTAAPSQPVTLVDGYIRAAIAEEMKRKGYEEAPAGAAPDLRIEYEAEKAEKVKNNPFRIGIGVGGYGSNAGGSVGVGSSSVKNVTEGTLVVHVIDPARNVEVWRGRASRELGKGNIEPASVNSAVADLMSDFPARAAQP
jgi:Domain of unknown function (DUF4136)